MISKTEKAGSPNFKKAYIMANQIIVCSTTMDGFPFKAKALVKEQADIAFCTFEKASIKFGLDIRQFGSESAVLMEMNGAHIIFYNQSEALYRIRFSILHEFGHYILGHKRNLSYHDALYGVQEVEANCFAAQILMPEQLLRELSKRGMILSEEFIMRVFNVSWEAAEKRINTLARTKEELHCRDESEYDDVILYKYEQFLNSIAPKSSSYFYSFEEEYEREQERSTWLYQRPYRS